jgi:hypothetical protein
MTNEEKFKLTAEIGDLRIAARVARKYDDEDSWFFYKHQEWDKLVDLNGCIWDKQRIPKAIKPKIKELKAIIDLAFKNWNQMEQHRGEFLEQEGGLDMYCCPQDALENFSAFLNGFSKGLFEEDDENVNNFSE